MQAARSSCRRPQDESFLLRKYIRDISQIPPISREEEQTLRADLRHKRNTAVARRRLITGNLRFVIAAAAPYRRFGVPFLDLINEGNIGLIKATERFDPKRNNRFLSYAKWWIRQAILDAISEKARLIRLPQKARRRLLKVLEAQAALEQELHRNVPEDEIAVRVHLPPREVTLLLEVARSPASRLLHLSPYAQKETDGSILLERALFQHATLPATAALLKHSLKRLLQKALEGLTQHERMVVCMRFGLGGEEPKSLAEIGRQMDYSRERIRQFERDALQKLGASPHCAPALRTYLRNLPGARNDY
jgi:RNA polymerase primary sigma factor